ncbi:hypothetical protein D4T97_001655 [Siminovitchia acidinfaciens]|uniref:SDR family oxidoreductase n=1 Tax=Siminovitchia acidinfaciens TaxID=2321395 RepID=A0A429Y8J6_9BACI|nr:hypothetical protein D4T97_001655 [Siminovitchia acidinfaciens]
MPVKRVETCGEVAKLLHFLTTKEAVYITGATFDINGGLLMS